MSERNRCWTSNQKVKATVSFLEGSWFGEVTSMWLILRMFIILGGQLPTTHLSEG